MFSRPLGSKFELAERFSSNFKAVALPFQFSSSQRMLLAPAQVQPENLRLRVILKMQIMMLTCFHVILGRGGQPQSMMSMSRTELEEDTLHWDLANQKIMFFHKEVLEVCADSWLDGLVRIIGLSTV